MTRFFIVVISISAASAATAHAGEGDRFELDFAFLAGARSYDEVPFSYSQGDASPALAAPRLGGIAVAGPSFGARAIIRNVRIGFGYERPYARNFNRVPLKTGAVQIRALSAITYRFALGYELPLGPVTPFVDLVGTAEAAEIDLLAGDTQSTFDTEVFGYSLQAGARVPFSRFWFLQVAAEVGPISPVDWAVHAGVGLGIH